jgi:hypothetical protein
MRESEQLDSGMGLSKLGDWAGTDSVEKRYGMVTAKTL